MISLWCIDTVCGEDRLNDYALKVHRLAVEGLKVLLSF